MRSRVLASSMTAIAGSAAIGRGTGRSSRATRSNYRTVSGCGARNIPRSRSPISSARCNTSRRTDSRASAAEASFLHPEPRARQGILARRSTATCRVSRPSRNWPTPSSPRTAPAFYRISLLLWGRDFTTAALRARRVPVPAPVRADLSCRPSSPSPCRRRG